MYKNCRLTFFSVCSRKACKKLFTAAVARSYNRLYNCNLLQHEKTLCLLQIRLNKRVIDAVQNELRTGALWRALIWRALHLEDIEAAARTGALPGTSANGPSTLLQRYVPPALRLLWHTTLKRPLVQLAGVVCALLTVLIVWSECTFFIVRPQLSLAARILHSAAIGYHYKYIQVKSEPANVLKFFSKII